MFFKTICEKMQATAIAHIAGETSTLEKARFLAHLDECDDCRAGTEAAADLMAATKNERFLPSSRQRDRMFQVILSRVETDASVRKIDTRASSTRRRRLVFAAAAAAVVLGSVLFLSTFKETRESGVRLHGVAHNETKTPSPGGALTTEHPYAYLTLGITDGTRFKIEEHADMNRLLLERGTIWIRFDKSPKAKPLSVVGSGVTARIIGTVLVVHAVPGQVMAVGVLKGRVETTSELFGRQLLAAGDWRRADGAVTTMPPRRREEGERWLRSVAETTVHQTGDDVRFAPRDAGETARAPESAAAPAKRSERHDSRALYREAERMMAIGDYAQAADLLERVVRKNSASDTADTARLDLAGLYSRRLSNPKRAAYHLEAYLGRHPNGAKSRLVKARLCALKQTTGTPAADVCAGQ